MNTFIIIIVTCIFCIRGILNSVSFLQLLKPSIPVQFMGTNKLHFNVSMVDFNEEEEKDDEELSVKQVLTVPELRDLKSIVAKLDTYEIHETFYDPFSNQTHRRKRSVASNTLVLRLNKIVEHLEKMEESDNSGFKKRQLDAATVFLDEYIQTIKSFRENGEKNALQLFKMAEYNLLLVNCGGWLWYPVHKVKEVLHCKQGTLRFEKRSTQTAQICDDFFCKRITL